MCVKGVSERDRALFIFIFFCKTKNNSMFTIQITMISMLTHIDVFDYINNYHLYFKGVNKPSYHKISESDMGCTY